MNLEKLICLLEERLVEHDNNRKEVQDKLQEACSKAFEEANLLEESITKELQKTFNEKEEHVLSIIEKLNNEGGEENNGSFIEQTKDELSCEVKYEIQHIGNAKSFADSYKLKITKTENITDINNENDIQDITNRLQTHLNNIHESMTAAQNDLAEICTKKKNGAEELKNEINEKLETSFAQEDSRLQEALSLVRENVGSKTSEELEELVAKAKATLVVKQSYSLDKWNLKVNNETSLDSIDFEKRKPSNVTASFTSKNDVSLSFTFFYDHEVKLLKPLELAFSVLVFMFEKGDDRKNKKATKIKYFVGSQKPILIEDVFAPSTIHCLRMRIEYRELKTEWSDDLEFTTPEFKSLCSWKECKGYLCRNNYSVDENNPRITKIINLYSKHCIIIGKSFIPINKVVSWGIKILKSKFNDGDRIFVGVIPFDVHQLIKDNLLEQGWYFHCGDSTLHSGPPHYYNKKGYGPMIFLRKTIKSGIVIGVVMDTEKDELSFSVDNKSYGIAYKNIPLDKPLVPCVLLSFGGDCIELINPDAKDYEVDSSIPVPSNIAAKSETWDSITLKWDSVRGASCYQIEVDGSKYLGLTSTNTFMKKELFEDTEHSFRVRTMRGNSVSEWSGVVKGRTIKSPDISGCVWKKCPDSVDENRKYFVDVNNPKVVTIIGDNKCTGIGNTLLPTNKITSWNIKILKSRDNNGNCIYIGVAPFDIDQNAENYNKCGWYFECRRSTLFSGPPHNYKGKLYGPKKEKWGEYIHTRDSVGVVMDTTKGELSFVLGGVNYGIAYKGIPLDKPLVPCVLLKYKADSVELVI